MNTYYAISVIIARKETDEILLVIFTRFACILEEALCRKSPISTGGKGMTNKSENISTRNRVGLCELVWLEFLVIRVGGTFRTTEHTLL